MAKYISCSDGFLFNKGIKPILTWIFRALIGYSTFFILNKFVVSINNLILNIVWVLLIVILLFLWYSLGDKIVNRTFKGGRGWLGEVYIGTLLRFCLPNNYTLISDVRIKTDTSNIDFVIIAPHGVYTLEVKNWMKWINIDKEKAVLIQARNEAWKIHELLETIPWVQPVVVFCRQKHLKGEQHEHEGVWVTTRKNIVSFFLNPPTQPHPISKIEHDQIVKKFLINKSVN